MKGQKTNNAALNIISKTVMYIVLILISLLSLLPIIWVFTSSFKTNAEILSSGLSLPQSWNFDGYVNAFKIAPIHTFYLNSIFIAVLSTLLNVFLIGMAAYVIARFNFRFKNLLIMLFAATLMLPMTALIQPVYLVIKSINLSNTRTGLILVYVALGLPTTFFVMRGFFLNLPRSIEEAAYIDGAGFFYTFVRIVLPMAKPGMATAAVMQFITSWNEFLYALVLTTSQNIRTLPIALNYFKTQFSFNYTAMFAAVVVIIIPSIVAYVLLQEQVIGSLTAGSIKG
ncbi:MAG: carbohydrate ABC transporter permease [Oscillospiraceae bacterium]|nr:carbohydrate ABC transporter permease [Oscillospiraceae bacterium]